MKNEALYYRVLKEELLPAMGCTEPISVAFASAKAASILGGVPETIAIFASGGLIKNIRCVTVPNTDGLIGIEASAIAGAISAKPEKELEVLEDLSEEDKRMMRVYLSQNRTTLQLLETPHNLHFIIRASLGDNTVEIEVKHLHTNITKIIYNDDVLFHDEGVTQKYQGKLTDRSFMTVEEIIEFATTTEWSRLQTILQPQIEKNMAIAMEGFSKPYGVSIGKALLKHYPTVYGKMKAYTASASEARMCGSNLPVITNSGSGNQGIASSVPIIVYAQEMNLSTEQMIRALALSNLLTIYQKSYIGRLSAFCGAISATASSGAALTYLCGGSLEQIKMTIINSLADAAGVVCDGAKASCASKIATGLDSAFLSHFLALENQTYQPYTGFLKLTVDEAIHSVGRIATEGMKDTDRVILQIMLEK